MGCELLFHELLLFALLGLGLTLYRIWHRSRPAPDQGERKPATQATRHSKDQQPFAGLTTKPHCEACEHTREPAAPPPPAPPPLLASKRGRPRKLDVHTRLSHENMSLLWLDRTREYPRQWPPRGWPLSGVGFWKCADRVAKRTGMARRLPNGILGYCDIFQ